VAETSFHSKVYLLMHDYCVLIFAFSIANMRYGPQLRSTDLHGLLSNRLIVWQDVLKMNYHISLIYTGSIVSSTIIWCIQ